MLIILAFCLITLLSSSDVPVAAENETLPLIEAARSQIGQTLYYEPSYVKLSYPMGDISVEKGVCTDVIIRALRPHGIDLQKEVAESIAKNYSNYKLYLTNGRADKNIDHRRVKVLATYFSLQGFLSKEKLKAGDIAVFDLGKGIWHIGIVSDRLSSDKKRLLVIHNICCGVKEEDMITQFPILYCFRITKDFFNRGL